MKNVYSRDGQWFCVVETEKLAREYGPFETKREASDYRGLVSVHGGVTLPVQPVPLLDDRERDILHERSKKPPTNLRTLSVKYDISRERVRQIERAASNKVKGITPVRPTYDSATIARFRPLFMRSDATELEIAEAIKEMIALGVPQAIIAESYGKQETWISFIKKLNKMPDTLLDYLRSKVVKTTALIKAVDQFGPDKTERAISTIIAERKRKGRPQKITQRELFERTAA